jgi:AraC-like DNA-binding protein
MTLAKAITDRDGNTLLATGTILDSEMLDRLIRRGIEAITVLVDDPRDAETIASDLAAAEARVAYIFRGAGSPSRSALRQAILAYRMENAR